MSPDERIGRLRATLEAVRDELNTSPMFAGMGVWTMALTTLIDQALERDVADG